MKCAAKYWLKTMDPDTAYNELVKQVKIAFKPVGMTEVLEKKLSERKCMKGETGGEYYCSILDLCKRVDENMSEGLKKQNFIRDYHGRLKNMLLQEVQIVYIKLIRKL